MTITTPICARIGCDTSVLKDGQLCSDCHNWMARQPMPPVKPPAPEPKPAQFAMSNDELRRAIQHTSEEITKLYDGIHKEALRKHLIALLEIERGRAAQIILDENTQR